MGVRERRRQELVDAARALFLERGFDQVMIEDIADRCGVTRRTVYRYFATRDHVALAVEVDVLERWSALLKELSQHWSGTGADRLRAAFADVEGLVDDHADEVRFTQVFDLRPDGDDDSDLREKYEAAIRALLLPIVEVLRMGERDGTLRLEAPPEVTASTLTNAYLGLAQRVYGFGERLAQEQAVEPRRMLTELGRLYGAALIRG